MKLLFSPQRVRQGKIIHSKFRKNHFPHPCLKKIPAVPAVEFELALLHLGTFSVPCHPYFHVNTQIQYTARYIFMSIALMFNHPQNFNL